MVEMITSEKTTSDQGLQEKKKNPFFYANLMIEMQKYLHDILNDYVPAHLIWFQDPIFKMSSTNPVWP